MFSSLHENAISAFGGFAAVPTKPEKVCHAFWAVYQLLPRLDPPLIEEAMGMSWAHQPSASLSSGLGRHQHTPAGKAVAAGS